MRKKLLTSLASTIVTMAIVAATCMTAFASEPPATHKFGYIGGDGETLKVEFDENTEKNCSTRILTLNSETEYTPVYYQDGSTPSSGLAVAFDVEGTTYTFVSSYFNTSSLLKKLTNPTVLSQYNYFSSNVEEDTIELKWANVPIPETDYTVDISKKTKYSSGDTIASEITITPHGTDISNVKYGYTADVSFCGGSGYDKIACNDDIKAVIIFPRDNKGPGTFTLYSKDAEYVGGGDYVDVINWLLSFSNENITTNRVDDIDEGYGVQWHEASVKDGESCNGTYCEYYSSEYRTAYTPGAEALVSADKPGTVVMNFYYAIMSSSGNATWKFKRVEVVNDDTITTEYQGEKEIAVLSNALLTIPVSITVPAGTPEGEQSIKLYYDYNTDPRYGDTSALVEGKLNIKFGGHDITFETNGGEDVEVLENYSAIPEELPTTTKDGAKFVGWYLDTDLTEAVVGGTEISEDVTLYAKWESITPPKKEDEKKEDKEDSDEKKEDEKSPLTGVVSVGAFATALITLSVAVVCSARKSRRSEED